MRRTDDNQLAARLLKIRKKNIILGKREISKRI